MRFLFLLLALPALHFAAPVPLPSPQFDDDDVPTSIADAATFDSDGHPSLAGMFPKLSAKDPKNSLYDFANFLEPMVTVVGIQLMSGCAKTKHSDMCGGPTAWKKAWDDFYNPPKNNPIVKKLLLALGGSEAHGRAVLNRVLKQLGNGSEEEGRTVVQQAVIAKLNRAQIEF
jgi:hypothetical protein